MSDLPNCPECSSEYTYEDRGLYVCPECAHEWTAAATEDGSAERVIRDANGNPLADGDMITVIKDLKVKGTSSVVKVAKHTHCLMHHGRLNCKKRASN